MRAWSARSEEDAVRVGRATEAPAGLLWVAGCLRRARGCIASFRRTVVASLLAALPACDGSAPAAASAGATLRGFAMEGSPVILVASAADAPPGDRPVVNAEVKALDLDHNLLATASTGGDGAFVLKGLPQGYVRIELRKNAAAPDPDALAEATAIDGADVGVGASFAVTRDAAVLAAMGGVSETALVACSMQPLPAGALVVPNGGDPDSDDPVPTVGRLLPAPEWFVYVDRVPEATFAHPVEYVFVDASTGAVVREANVQWPPLVNGTGLWNSEHTLFALGAIDLDVIAPEDIPEGTEIVPSPEVVQVPRAQPGQISAPLVHDPLSSLALHNSDPASIFVIIWRAASEDYMVPEVLRVLDFFEDAGIPSANIAYTRSLSDGDVDIQDTGYMSWLRTFNQRIDERLDHGEHSTLVVYITSHGGGGAFGRYHHPTNGVYKNVYPGNLDLTSTRACRLRGIFNFCYSGKFVFDLAQLFDAIPPAARHDYAFYAACGINELSYSHSLYLWNRLVGNRPGSQFTNMALDYAQVVNGDVTGLLDATGTQMRSELRAWSATWWTEEGINSSQHPYVRVGNNIPGWCVGVEPVTGVILRETLTPELTAGTFVALDRIQGAHVADPDVCATIHLHSVSPGGILIDGQGPYPDTDPSGCGYGAVVTR